MMSDRNGPVARPTLDDGELYVLSEEDAGELAAEAYAWLRELPELDDARAEEISTMIYELITGEWGRALDDDSDT
jgi:hypothetical protein